MSTEVDLDSVRSPEGAETVYEWSDIGAPSGPWRQFSGPRRSVERYYIGSSPVGPHFVEAHGIQNADGSLDEVCIRAQVDVWDMDRHDNWDTELTPDDARRKAREIRGHIATLTMLATAFEAAAAEVDQWTEVTR